MSNQADAEKLFHQDTGLTEQKILSAISDSFKDCDDGELYLEYSQSESVVLDDGKIKSSSFNSKQGFGLRAVLDDSVAYSHSSQITKDKLKSASEAVKAIKFGKKGKFDVCPETTTNKCYKQSNPIYDIEFAKKVNILEQIDIYARKKDLKIKQVSASINNSWKIIKIIRPDGFSAIDVRPMTRLNVSVTLEENGKMESGFYGFGGRYSCLDTLKEDSWKKAVDEAIRQANVNLSSVSAPAGEMPVVLGAGWCGVLLHEAVGHGLEGDFNRKGTSVFTGKIGEKVASDSVTIIDEGNIPNRRGSLNIDDEGTATSKNVLIENGVLKGYMQDRMNARLMKTNPTGNGRRQSYADMPIPRMTNTYMTSGKYSPEEIIKSVEKGLYAVQFSGGQVDVVSGKFVFSSSEAYLIENGKVTQPVKGATLIGSGFDVMQKISMTGNDSQLDPGIGVCGKSGQGVAVGVGQPTLKIDSITVGGTSI